MLIFRNSYVFSDEKEKLSKCLVYASPLIIFSVISLFNSIGYIEKFSLSVFINIALYSLFIGLAEEFIFRGWLQNEFIERFSNNKNTVLKSICLSSIIFGSMHIINILGNQGLYETIIQMLNATTLGFLLGCLYYKTKNIWSVIILHAFYDFALILAEMNVIKECTYTMPTFITTVVDSISILLMISIWLLCAYLIIIKTDYPGKKASKKKNPYIKYAVSGIIISFLLMFIPFDKIIPGYVDNSICYSYKKTSDLDNYIIHYPSLRNYNIDVDREELEYVENEDQEVFEEMKINNYNLEFEVNRGSLFINNKNTNESYETKFDKVKSVEVLQNSDTYVVIIHSNYNDDTIYYSNFITENNISNKKDFLEEFESSFIEYAVPIIENVGYITFDESEIKYPYFESTDGEEFIIKNGELFIVE